jgi:hypothetical protein
MQDTLQGVRRVETNTIHTFQANESREEYNTCFSSVKRMKRNTAHPFLGVRRVERNKLHNFNVSGE